MFIFFGTLNYKVKPIQIQETVCHGGGAAGDEGNDGW
jgi:hypothetical protein